MPDAAIKTESPSINKEGMDPSASGLSIRFGPFTGELEETACRLCGAATLGKLIYKSKEGIGYYRCRSCSLMYASPRFTEESLRNIYETPEFTDLPSFENWSYDNWRQGRARSYHVERAKVALIARHLPVGARILDVGCGTGLFVLLAGKSGYRCEGVEPSAMLAQVAREKLAVNVVNIPLDDFAPPYKYDGLVIWDVLEHLYDPLSVLKKCAQLMTAGGIIFAQVPHYRGISEVFKTSMCRLGLRRTYKNFGFPWHLYSFDRTSLTILMNKAGFDLLFFESWSHLLKDGKENLASRLAISLTRRFCLSDYLICAARKIS